jgi:hypothetical protein
MKKHISHKTIYRSKYKHEEQQTITREVITEFGTKLPTSLGLCLSGGGFFINYSMLAKKSTSNGLHSDLTMFFSTSKIQCN